VRNCRDGDRLASPFGVEEIYNVLDACWISSVVFGRNDDNTVGILYPLGKVEHVWARIRLVLQALRKNGKLIHIEIKYFRRRKISTGQEVLKIKRNAVAVSSRPHTRRD